jgi:putative hydrolase of the HAD superfamily
MRLARQELARREPHNAHDLTYLRLTGLAAHAREHGYEERMAHEAFEVFLAARNQVQLFADVTPGLARLGRRYPLGSLSNGNADLARIGLSQLFCVSLNARGVGAAKPDRRCFEKLASAFQLSAQAILYVGDEPLLDVEAARAAGCLSAWMNRKGAAWPEPLARADLEVRDCLELAQALGA